MKPIIYIAFLANFLFSCEIVLDVDVPYEGPSLVMNGVIHPDSLITIDLSEDAHILTDGNFYQIIDATVMLYANDVLIGQMPETTSAGVYSSNTYPEPGISYTITAEKRGFETVSASSSLPDQTVRPTNISTRIVQRDGWEQIEFSFDIEDPIQSNYYEIQVYNIDEWYYTEEYYDEILDEFITDTIRGVSIYPEYLELGAVSDSEFEDDPTAWGSNVYFDDALFNGKKHTIKVRADYYNYNDNTETSTRILVLKSCNKTYYDYYRSLRISDYADGDAFAEPVFIQSNVENGFGMFGGFVSEEVEIEISID